MDIFKENKNIPVIILAGGKGSRIIEKTKKIPKPLIKIGNKPILWHILKIYHSAKFSNFYIATGYKSEMIKNYFKKEKSLKNMNVFPCYTGLNSMTGDRIYKIIKNINSEIFCMTYGDGVANLDINKVLQFHLKHKKNATMTIVRPPARWGHVKSNKNQIISFEEKNQINEGWINGGFFILNKKIMKLFKKGSHTIFEKDVLPVLAKQGELMAYKHKGFWQCMDTLRDNLFLNNLWKKNPPWKLW